MSSPSRLNVAPPRRDRAGRRLHGLLLGAACLLLGTNPADAQAAAQAQTLDTERPKYCAAVPAASEHLTGATPYVYRRLASRDLRLHVFSPAEPAEERPAIVYFFGGGFRTGDVSSLVDSAAALSARGYVVVLADYRILCRDGVTALAGLEDAAAANRWVHRNARRLGVDPRRIALGGSSAGGLLAATTALRASRRDRASGLLLINPVLDLSSGLWSQDQDVQAAASGSASVLPVDHAPPTLILHGTADVVVPYSSSETFCARILAARRACTLTPYPGMHHSFNDSRRVSSLLGASPFDDSLSRSVRFLEGLAPVAR